MHTHKHRCGGRGNGFRLSSDGASFTFGFGRGFGGRNFGSGVSSGRIFGSGGPSGRRRSRMFDAGELRLVLLKLLEEQPRHGYDLIRAIEERTGGAYAPSPGTVYPTLTLLAEMGLADEVEAAGSRRKFAITEAGKADLAANQAAADAAMARLDALAGPSERADPAPVRRAMDNLGAVLRERLHAEGLERSALLDIAALIDEVAAKIERL